MFGGPCPPFSFGDTDACGAWPALLGAGGGECFRLSTAPALQRPPQPCWLCPAGCPLGAGSSGRTPGCQLGGPFGFWLLPPGAWSWVGTGRPQRGLGLHRQVRCDNAARATRPRVWAASVVMEQ